MSRPHGSVHYEQIGCGYAVTKFQKVASNQGKKILPPTPRDRSRSKTRTPPNLQPGPLGAPKAKLKPSMVATAVAIKENPPLNSVIRKEIFDAACVEVTVKTHGVPSRLKTGRSRSSSIAKDDTWGNIFRSQTELPVSNVSLACQLGGFDPLRTLHFLAKELQAKISEMLPQDSSLHHLVLDLQQALNRVPPEVASNILLQTPGGLHGRNSNSNIKNHRTKIDVNNQMEPEKLVSSPRSTLSSISKAEVLDKSIQTIKSINYAETEKLQKHLEESTEKIELFCKQMEAVCTRLKSEKDELEQLLKTERETVKELRQKLEDFELQKTSLNEVISRLHLEKEEASLEMKKLKVHLEAEMGPTSENLKSLIQEMRVQKAEADQEILSLKHELTVVTMKKEKYMAILSARDKQMSEIRSEMDQLQSVVKEQLMEIQHSQPSSARSSITNMTDRPSSWALINKKNDSKGLETGDMGVNTRTSETLENIFLNKKGSSYRELPSGDSSGTSTILREMHKNGTINNIEGKHSLQKHLKLKSKIFSDIIETSDTQTNVRNMFEQIKNQALELTGPVTCSSATVTESNPSTEK